jgi:hypothetical protein
MNVKACSAHTLVGTLPHPIETRQSIGVSGHMSCASRMAMMVGLLATIAPSCHRLDSANTQNRDVGTLTPLILTPQLKPNK